MTCRYLNKPIFAFIIFRFVDSTKSIEYTLIQNGFDMNKLKDMVEVSIYATDKLKIEDTLGSALLDAKAKYQMMNFILS